MSMLKICAASGCATRTLGEFCIAHESMPGGRSSRRAGHSYDAPSWTQNSARSVEPLNVVAMASR